MDVFFFALSFSLSSLSHLSFISLSHLSRFIQGWTEAMQLMHEGDRWELTIPSELAYGDQARGAHIKAGDVLVFDLEIIKINGATKDEL